MTGGIGGVIATIRGPSPTAIDPIAVPPGNWPGLKIFVGGGGGGVIPTIRGPSPTAIEPIAVPPGNWPGLKMFVGGGGGPEVMTSGAAPTGTRPTADGPRSI